MTLLVSHLFQVQLTFLFSFFELSNLDLALSHHVLIQNELTVLLQRLIEVLDVKGLRVEPFSYLRHIDAAEGLLLSGKTVERTKHLVKTASVVYRDQGLVVCE